MGNQNKAPTLLCIGCHHWVHPSEAHHTLRNRHCLCVECASEDEPVSRQIPLTIEE